MVRGGGYAFGAAALLLLLLRGSFGLFGMLASVLFAQAMRGGGNPFAAMRGAAGWGGKPKPSVARSAAIEMRLDRESGRMSGLVTAGPHAGRALDQMTRGECLDVYALLPQRRPRGRGAARGLSRPPVHRLASGTTG